MGTIKLFCYSIILITVFLSSNMVAQDSHEAISFRWALVGKTTVDGEKKIINIQHDTAMMTGDAFKMLIQPITKCYLYVLLRGSRSDMTLLFPYSTRDFKNVVSTEVSYLIPRGRLWYELDSNVGHETFYFIASPERLPTLEKALEDLKVQDEQSCEQRSQQVIQQINNLRKQNRKFTSIAEKPIGIAGNVRSIGNEKEIDRIDLSQYATEVEGNGFYIRTIVIDHR